MPAIVQNMVQDVPFGRILQITFPSLRGVVTSAISEARSDLTVDVEDGVADVRQGLEDLLPGTFFWRDNRGLPDGEIWYSDGARWTHGDLPGPTPASATAPLVGVQTQNTFISGGYVQYPYFSGAVNEVYSRNARLFTKNDIDFQTNSGAASGNFAILGGCRRTIAGVDWFYIAILRRDYLFEGRAELAVGRFNESTVSAGGFYVVEYLTGPSGKFTEPDHSAPPLPGERVVFSPDGTKAAYVGTIAQNRNEDVNDLEAGLNYVPAIGELSIGTLTWAWSTPVTGAYRVTSTTTENLTLVGSVRQFTVGPGVTAPGFEIGTLSGSTVSIGNTLQRGPLGVTYGASNQLVYMTVEYEAENTSSQTVSGDIDHPFDDGSGDPQDTISESWSLNNTINERISATLKWSTGQSLTLIDVEADTLAARSRSVDIVDDVTIDLTEVNTVSGSRSSTILNIWWADAFTGYWIGYKEVITTVVSGTGGDGIQQVNSRKEWVWGQYGSELGTVRLLQSSLNEVVADPGYLDEINPFDLPSGTPSGPFNGSTASSSSTTQNSGLFHAALHTLIAGGRIGGITPTFSNGNCTGEVTTDEADFILEIETPDPDTPSPSLIELRYNASNQPDVLAKLAPIADGFTVRGRI